MADRADTVRKGASAEALAAAFLETLGFRIVARNQRYAMAELDLIAEDGATLVFVEVRSRASDELGSPLETIDQRKRRRVVNGALAWLEGHPQPATRAMRVDVVGISYGETPPRIDHVAGAFDADGRID